MTEVENNYNNLPIKIKRDYDIRYSEYRGDNITTFMSKCKKWGAIVDDSKSLIPAKFDSIYYNNEFKYFECVLYSENNYRSPKTFVFYNQNGIEQGKIENIKFCIKHRFGYYKFQLANSQEWGIINTVCEVLIQDKYQNVGVLSKNIFEVQRNNKWGIINSEEKLILDFKASEIHGTFENDCVIVKIGDEYHKIDQNGKLIGNLGITHILRPHSNSYWSKTENIEKRKVLSNGKKREDVDHLYAFDELTDYIGKWGVIHLSGEFIIEPKYDYIDFFGLTECYKAMVGTVLFGHDQEGRLLLKGTKYGVIDSKGATVIPIEYDWIKEIAPNLWAVNNGGEVYYDDEYQVDYWTVRGGKWGVINFSNQEVVPISYDTIMTNWFRVKDLIIVQNGTTAFDASIDYDVYNFKGEKLDGKEIDYKNHIYYQG